MPYLVGGRGCGGDDGCTPVEMEMEMEVELAFVVVGRRRRQVEAVEGAPAIDRRESTGNRGVTLTGPRSFTRIRGGFLT